MCLFENRSELLPRAGCQQSKAILFFKEVGCSHLLCPRVWEGVLTGAQKGRGNSTRFPPCCILANFSRFCVGVFLSFFQPQIFF